MRELERHEQIALSALRVGNNPNITARLMAHSFKMPWERIQTLVSVLRCTVGIAESLTPEVYWQEVEADWQNAETCFRSCGSPIEELFLAQLIVTAPGEFTWQNDATGSGPIGQLEDQGLPPITLHQQLQIASYRVDFALCQLIASASPLRVAIELDGHEWHERTKEQATRDKSRDRKLQEIGWKVLRFTGSEIWADPRKCAFEALRIAGAL